MLACFWPGFEWSRDPMYLALNTFLPEKKTLSFELNLKFPEIFKRLYAGTGPETPMLSVSSIF